MIKVEDLTGEYQIIGSNQNDDTITYKGKLRLQQTQGSHFKATWLIHKEQEQFGEGFYKDNILVINFYYFDEDLNKYPGTVVYKCITANVLEGFWSEKFGDHNYIGTEQCFKINTENLTID